VRRGPGEVEKRGSPLPLRATAIVLALWMTGLVLLAFVVVPALFATCTGQLTGGAGP
jgi:hypothetical protein